LTIKEKAPLDRRRKPELWIPDVRANTQKMELRERYEKMRRERICSVIDFSFFKQYKELSIYRHY